MPKNKQQGQLSILILVIVALSAFALSGYLFYQYQNKPNYPPKQSNNISVVNQPKKADINPTNSPVSDKQVLIPYIGNFNKLTITDLPNFQDVRGVYHYKNNLIVTGIDSIAEYNPSTNNLVRVLDHTKLEFVYSTALIGDNLYVATVPDFYHGKSWQDSWARIYRIDLNSGSITKQYFGNPSEGKRRINLYLTSKDNYLWASSNDGIYKINTADDSIKEYDEAKLTLPTHCITSIFNQNVLFGFVNCSDKQGKLIYNESSDSWKYVEDLKMGRYINLRLKDFNLDLPTYLYISNLVNGKYYIFSDKGIFTLLPNEFPKLLNKVVLTDSMINPIVYITKDEKNAIAIGPQSCGPDPNCNPLVGVILDLATGSQTDLIKETANYQSLSQDDKFKLADAISHAKVEENADKLNFINTSNKTSLAIIDLNSKKLILNTTNP